MTGSYIFDQFEKTPEQIAKDKKLAEMKCVYIQAYNDAFIDTVGPNGKNVWCVSYDVSKPFDRDYKCPSDSFWIVPGTMSPGTDWGV